MSPSLGFYHTEFGEVVGELAAFCRHDRHAVMATPRCSKLMSAATPSQRRVRLEVGGCGSSRSTPTRQLHRQLSRAAFRSPRRQSAAATFSAHSGFRININPCRLDYHRDSASVHLLLMIEVHALFCRVRLTLEEWPLVAAQSRHSWFGTNWRWKVAAVVTATHLQHDDLKLLILLSRKRIPKP